MPTRVAINGFGRVGRAVLRAAHEQHADLEIVAINDLMDLHTMAHLLRYDSVYGRFDGTVEEGEGELRVDGAPVAALASAEAAELPWARARRRRRDRVDRPLPHARRGGRSTSRPGPAR